MSGGHGSAYNPQIGRSMEQTKSLFDSSEYEVPRRARAPDIFAPFRDWPSDRPFVVAQIGQSIDGRIATLSGESKNISGAPALDHLHRIRAQVDAVVVGRGTIIADDPRLTVRRVTGKNPTRVVIDPSGRLPSDGKWLACDGARRIVISATPPKRLAGVEHIQLPAYDGLIAPSRIVKALFTCGLRRLLIEGGAHTIAAFINAGCIDRLHALVAPIIIGSGRVGLDLSPISRLKFALRPHVDIHLLGDGDVLFDCDFSDCGRRRSN
jgi:diaminohydroxyphosphoribosylaminopyrimidine deaminase/5-amino-6-(5-phosphoribosylamino)uracil reductase